jgi:hypothetical protein
MSQIDSGLSPEGVAPCEMLLEPEVVTDVRFEIFTALTVKNVVFWDIKPQFVLHSRHIRSPLQGPAG